MQPIDQAQQWTSRPLQLLPGRVANHTMGESPETGSDAAFEADPRDAPASEDQTVDIHKPKAAHSWREFLIEIGTIVCGILIALALEQAVEAAHNHADVQEAREALRAELKANVTTLVFGMAEDKCLLPQLDAYAAWARGGAKPRPFRSALAGYSSSNWETTKTNAVAHMPLQERLAVADFYDLLSNEQKVVELQRTNSLVLTGADELRVLGQAETSRILETVAVERKLAGFHIGNGENLLASAVKLGVQPSALPPVARRALAQLCGKSA